MATNEREGEDIENAAPPSKGDEEGRDGEKGRRKREERGAEDTVDKAGSRQ